MSPRLLKLVLSYLRRPDGRRGSSRLIQGKWSSLRQKLRTNISMIGSGTVGSARYASYLTHEQKNMDGAVRLDVRFRDMQLSD